MHKAPGTARSRWRTRKFRRRQTVRRPIPARPRCSRAKTTPFSESTRLKWGWLLSAVIPSTIFCEKEESVKSYSRRICWSASRPSSTSINDSGTGEKPDATGPFSTWEAGNGRVGLVSATMRLMGALPSSSKPPSSAAKRKASRQIAIGARRLNRQRIHGGKQRAHRPVDQ